MAYRPAPCYNAAMLGMMLQSATRGVRYVYDQCLLLAQHRYALFFLCLCAYTESIFFPIPPEVMLAPMVLAVPTRAWAYVGWATLASMLGGITCYYIGLWLYAPVVEPILQALCAHNSFVCPQTLIPWVASGFERWGFGLIVATGISMVPDKFVALVAGSVGMDIVPFAAAWAVGRGIRMAIVAWLIMQFGPAMMALVERHLGWILTLLCAILAMAWIVASLV